MIYRIDIAPPYLLFQAQQFWLDLESVKREKTNNMQQSDVYY